MVASIVIPAFNAETTITAAIESCLAQTIEDIEVIVVDDASSDGTAAVVRQLAQRDSRLNLITLSENGGVAHARNVALEAAKGDWIALLDADDTYASSRLETMVRIAEEKQADMLADNLQVMFADGRLSTRVAFPLARMQETNAISAAQLAAADRPRWGLPAAGFMKPIVRRRFLNEHNLQYVRDRNTVEDFHFYMHCLMSGARLFYIPQALYNYTVNERSLSRSDSTTVRRNLVNSSQRLCSDAENIGDTEALVELKKRDEDLRLWLAFKMFESAAHEKRYSDAFTAFIKLPSKKYALVRFAGQLRYALSLRVGLSMPVRESAPGKSRNFLKRRYLRTFALSLNRRPPQKDHS